MNNMTFEKLHYDKLKEIVLYPSSNIKNVNRMLDETSEGRRLLDAGYHIPLEGIFDICPLLDKIDKGGVLEPSELTSICDFLRGCRKIKSFIKDKEGYAETLSSYGENITELKYIEEEIENAIRGSIVDSNATKDLKKIRRQISICEEKIKEKLEKFIKNTSNREYLQEFFVSQRYTVPIKAAYKNHVQGSIVEVSSKGSTVFIEPNIISKYTVELVTLTADESVEEYKILSTISEMIYDRIQSLKVNIDVISEYDMILAKAKYSREINGIKPRLNDCGYINIIQGRYNLIENCIPLDFQIGDSYRSLIITGPNAGGKTVVLKTVGLMTLAVMSGFHVSCREGSEMSVFDKVFVDIGDNQSVENSLSTFSSHVKNLAEILKDSRKNTLLLFDEIGSGTEPNEGAALAIAILEEFYHKGCITVASTHYGEIKNFSENHPHFENAAMEFKKDTLEPLYRLHIGKIGDSNALYISEKMGIPESILKKSRMYMGNKNYNYEKLKDSKIKRNSEEKSFNAEVYFEKGDKVTILDINKSGIVYKEINQFNNVIVFVDGDFKEINYKRLKIEFKSIELYPEGYDLNQLFVSYKERKLEHDIERGSKKALKKIKKESKV